MLEYWLLYAVIVGSLGSIPSGGKIFIFGLLYPEYEESSSEAAREGGGEHSAPFCDLVSLKRPVRSASGRVARPKQAKTIWYLQNFNDWVIETVVYPGF